MQVYFFHNSLFFHTLRLADAYLRQPALQVSLRRAEYPQGVESRLRTGIAAPLDVADLHHHFRAH